MLFDDRRDAGRKLAERLRRYAGRDDVVVLGLPRGGVPVAYEVARALDAPLDVCMVRKLGVPGHEELAMGAVAYGGVRVVNEVAVESLGIDERIVDAVTRREMRELERRQELFRGGRPPLDVEGRVVILVDDGLATGSTMQAAVAAVRALSPARVIVGVPVGAPEVCASFRTLADDVVCVETPSPFFGVGLWYRDFSQVSDEVVKALLEEATPFSPEIGADVCADMHPPAGEAGAPLGG